jgi:hypothetical protein
VALFFLGQGEGQRLERRLGHVVGGAVSGIVARGNRGHHDDVTAGPLPHLRDEEVGQMEGPHDMDAEESRHLLGFGLAHRASLAGDPGVGDQNVNGTVGRQDVIAQLSAVVE